MCQTFLLRGYEYVFNKRKAPLGVGVLCTFEYVIIHYFRTAY